MFFFLVKMNDYLAIKILKACKAHKVVSVSYNTFAGASTSNFAANIKNVLLVLQSIATNEGYTFSLLEKKVIKHTASDGGEYFIDCSFDTEYDDIIYVRLVCSVDLDIAQCSFLLTLVEQ